jgi:uncharacterized C2H2 Zn-finger protein
MVLRCPSCSELRFFGRPQVLGEVVVCPRCETVFAWREAGERQAAQETKARGKRDGRHPDAKS